MYGINRGLVQDCEIFANLRLKLYYAGSGGAAVLPQHGHPGGGGRGDQTGGHGGRHPGGAAARQVGGAQDCCCVTVVAIVRFSYYGPELQDLCKVQKVLVMFTDLFGTEKFDVKCLVSLCCMSCEWFQCVHTPDKVLHHCPEELPRGFLPQLDPRLPRRQQRVRHAQVLQRHLQTARGGTGVFDK